MKTNYPRTFHQVATVAVALTATWLATSSTCAVGSSSVVITELYGAGGNSGAALNSDYAVLFNRGASSQNISNWSLHGGGPQDPPQ